MIETSLQLDSIFSSSSQRPLSNANDFVRGSVNNQPFRPGGLEIEDTSNLSSTSFFVNEELIDDNDIDSLLWFLNPNNNKKGELLSNFNPASSHGLTSESNVRIEMKPEEMASLYESIAAADAESEKEIKHDIDEKIDQGMQNNTSSIKESIFKDNDLSIDSDFLELEELLQVSLNPLNFASSLANK